MSDDKLVTIYVLCYGDYLDLHQNPLSCDRSIEVHIPALEDRGVTVDWTDTGQCDAPPPPTPEPAHQAKYRN